MLIRKNTKAFKTILEIVSACQTRADREKLIRLYITKAGSTIRNRIGVDGIQGDTALFYEMNYQNVLNNLHSSNHQLHVSEEVSGIYFFRNSSNKTWDEAPFEFDESVLKVFGDLPEAPVVRKREKTQKTILPVGKTKKTSLKKATVKKEKQAGPRAVVSNRGPRQPGYKLKRKIVFSDLEKILFRQPQLTKRDVLNYYDRVAELIVPYLKDRPLWVRRHSGKGQSPVGLSKEGFFKNHAEPLPDWLQSKTVSIGRVETTLLLCNDKEHLLFYVECGCVEFNAGHARVKSISLPDYIILAFDFPDSDPAQSADVIAAIRTILDGLRLSSFRKSDGVSGLEVYVPLDGKSNFTKAEEAAQYIAKLVKLKMPDRISLRGTDEYVYGRVSVESSINSEGGYVIAPYSLLAGDTAAISEPLSWDDLENGLRYESFNEEKISKRLKNKENYFAELNKKKANADDLVKLLERSYGFLL